jgi:hypothetical protein
MNINTEAMKRDLNHSQFPNIFKLLFLFRQLAHVSTPFKNAPTIVQQAICEWIGGFTYHYPIRSSYTVATHSFATSDH